MTRLSPFLFAAAASLLIGLPFSAKNLHAADAPYDPLKLRTTIEPKTQDFTVHDDSRTRDIPIRVFFPEQKDAPVVLFSHGLGGSREGSAYLGQHWAARGYITVYVQHPGSDDGVWRNTARDQRMAALKQAAGVQNFLLRVKDIPAVLNQLERWNKEDGHALLGRLNMKLVGMSGHSFGAVTTEAVSGESLPMGGAVYTDPRIKAAVAFSPSPPSRGDAAQAFGSVKIPWMLMTGTKDNSPISNADPASRLLVYPALPPGGKYELVLNKAEHSAFTDSALPGDREPRNPNHHRAILALTTAFWDAHLKEDAAAKAWLDGDGPKTVLEKEDRWQRK